MTAQLLLRHLERLAEADAAPARLREVALALGLHGEDRKSVV